MRKFSMAAAAAVGVAAFAGAVLAQDETIGDLKIGHPWVLPAPAGAPTAAGYLTLTNRGKTADRLLGVDVAEATKVEIHHMIMDGAIMRMRPVPDGIVVPPGQTVTLAPGGYHLMLIGPKRAFKVGEHLQGVLRFEHAGLVKIDFPVQVLPPQGDDHPPMAMH